MVLKILRTTGCHEKCLVSYSIRTTVRRSTVAHVSVCTVVRSTAGLSMEKSIKIPIVPCYSSKYSISYYAVLE